MRHVELRWRNRAAYKRNERSPGSEYFRILQPMVQDHWFTTIVVGLSVLSVALVAAVLFWH
jgi:multisubunit Na+/H+ antiporter MnhC subunit